MERLSSGDTVRIREELHEITGHTLAEVRITRVRWPAGLQWVALPLVARLKPTPGRREVPLGEAGLHQTIAHLLRNAFPHADWSHAQDYDVTTGVLREHTPRVPSCLTSDAR
ncbi:hypothetical protein AB0F46_39125 [Streptomyces sp. NPDC026665]|uniref:hypothetical protein n=1 Tax=Streptomyces sp. NPDC026665 TaxID=3154798 RepID=UPI0033FCA210